MLGTVASARVAKRYRSPTAAGVFAVNSVHVYTREVKKSISKKTEQECRNQVDKCIVLAVIMRTERTSQPFSAFRCLASVKVDERIVLSLYVGGLANDCGLRRDKSCLIAGGRCLTMAAN